MNAAETGTLWGLIVALVPGIRIKLGKPTLNKRQKRPILAYIFFWLVAILGFVGMPLIWLSLGLGDVQPGSEDFTVAISGLIFSILFLGLLGAIPLNHCYAFYLELREDHVRWRNWRWKERTFTYPSITFAHVENNGKNGFLRIGSTEMGKRTCSFDPYQFDATILMAQVLYRDDHGRWAEEDGLDVMNVVGCMVLRAIFMPSFMTCAKRSTSLGRRRVSVRSTAAGLLVMRRVGWSVSRRVRRHAAKKNELVKL